MAADDAPTGPKWVPHADFAVAAFRSPRRWATQRQVILVVAALAVYFAVSAWNAQGWVTLRGAFGIFVVLAAMEALGFGPRGWTLVAVFAHELQVGHEAWTGRPALGGGFKMPKEATRVPWSDIDDLRVDGEGLVIDRRGAQAVRVALLAADRRPLFAELHNRWTRYLETRSDTPRSAERARRAVEALR